MATYYVSPSGSNANAGTGPLASQAWLTVDYAMSNASSAGDIVYIAPGTYRELCTCDYSGSSGNHIQFIGDPLNTKGFKDGSGVLLTSNDVTITNYLTNYTTASSSSTTINVNSKSYLTFSSLVVSSGNNSRTIDIYNNCRDITIADCLIVALGQNNISSIVLYTPVDTNANVVIERCRFIKPRAGYAVTVQTPLSATADFAVGVTIRNCQVFGGTSGFQFAKSGSGSGKPGGMVVHNCLFYGMSGQAVRVETGVSTTYPVLVYNNILAATTGLQVADADTLTEDYNLFCCVTNRTGTIAAGANSIADAATALLFDAADFQCKGLPSMWAPAWDSPTRGFGNHATYTSATDFLNRPRPSGGASASKAVGAVEFHNYGVRDTSTKQASDAALKLTGPGDHDIKIPVSNSSTTISLYCRRDTGTYTLGTRPRATLLANASIGVSSEAKTGSAGGDGVGCDDAWEQLTFSAITPTAKGVVTIRLENLSTAGAGVCWFDTVAVS